MAALVLERDDELLLASDAADVLGISAPMVRWYANEGRIPTYRTSGGVRLFKLSDVQQFQRTLRGRDRSDGWTRKTTD
jgi:excisionase family DNA binding protein